MGEANAYQAWVATRPIPDLTTAKTVMEILEVGIRAAFRAGYKAGSVQELRWTTELPTEAGWYWLRNHVEGDAYVIHMQFEFNGGPLGHFHRGWQGASLFRDVKRLQIEDPERQWAGPIPLPSEAP